MKKQLKKVAILSFALITLTSCSKDDDKKTFAKEDFLAEYTQLSGFDAMVTNFVNSGDYEFGLDFTPLVEGKINKINVKIPGANSNLRITIWDRTNGNTVIKSQTFNYPTADVQVSYDIEPLQLVKDREYTITFNSNDWYKRNKADNSNTTYPIVAGNIQVDGYRWVSGTTQTFPTNVSSNYNAGDLSFEFQQTK